MSSNEILSLVLCLLIAICYGSNIVQVAVRYDLTKYVHGKNLVSSATTHLVESRSFLHCRALCHASKGCRGVAYAHHDCWFIDATKTPCQIFSGECNTCSYKVMMQTFRRDTSGKYVDILQSLILFIIWRALTEIRFADMRDRPMCANTRYT